MAFSSTPPQCTYHVFLSFRGEDTRKAFTDHLYTALLGSGFRTFRDNDVIGRGENVKSELDNAIRESRSSIIVFSKDYASSRWCLDELVMILEHKRTSGHVILPVFYDVDPSQVRKQMGSFAEAFGRHEERFMGETNERKKEYLRKKVEGWRAALREVADLAGMVLQNQADGHEDMGREIVRQESPKELGKRSRLWHNNDSFNVLRDKTGTDSIEGLFLDMHVLGEDNCSMTSFGVNNAKRPRFEELSNKSLLADQGNSQKRHCFGFFSWHPINIGVRNSNQVELETDAFARMRKLRLLQLNYAETTRGDFSIESLIALGLRNISLEQVWKGTKPDQLPELGKMKYLTVLHADGTAINRIATTTSEDKSWSSLFWSWNPISSLPESIKGLNVLQSLRLSRCTRLQSLPELPMSLEMLNSSLGMVTNLPNLLRSLILDSKMIYNLGLVDLESMGSLEGLYECGIYSICVPGNEVPGWCSNKRKGSSISFNVPLVPNLKIIALNVDIVYAFANYISLASSYQFDYIKISNKTKGLKWTYSPMFSGTPDDNTMIWFSRWEIGRLLMEGGDKMNLSASFDDVFQVKEVGVQIVYDECEEKGIQHRNAHPSHHNVMNVGDLSEYHVRTGSYFLCHHGYDCHQDYHQDGSSSKTDKILFGDSEETTDGLQMKNEEKKIERKDNSKRVTCCWQWLGQEH
ncbi:unnamed protein product [Camellia sinensis]